MAKTVRKIKLDSTKKGKKEVTEAKVVSKKTTKPASPTKRRQRRGFNPLVAFVGYLKGSWHEIRQVRWPDRRATWGMTLAVIGFTAFFSLVILLLDTAFQWLFKDFILK